MDAVANIPELFEGILDLLRLLDLVVASRVNRTFHNFITKSSKKLRRKLFRLSTKSATSEDDMDRWGVISRFMSCQDDYYQITWRSFADGGGENCKVGLMRVRQAVSGSLVKA